VDSDGDGHEDCDGTDCAPLDAATWSIPGEVAELRVAKIGTGADARLEAFLSPGNAAFGAPFAVTSTGTWTSATNRLQLGATSGVPVGFWFDDLLLDSAAMPGGTGPATQRFTPVADARVYQATPDTNLGADTTLQVRNRSGSTSQSFLRFDLATLSGGAFSAKLRLFCTDASGRGGRLFALTSHAWSEGAITWNNKPPLPSVGGIGIDAVTSNTWIELDVRSLISGPGTYDFGLGGGSGDSVSYGSRESSHPPELVIERAGP